MFQSLEAMPADAILGLIAEYKKDHRADKIDLGVGVYMTPEGMTPVLDVVKIAERFLLETQETKTYIGTFGDIAFCDAMQTMTFGNTGDADRMTTLQGPGGSGCLRVAAGLLMRARPGATVWVSDPTWANHIPLLGGVGLELKPYPYYDTEKHVLREDAMLDTLRKAPKGDVVLLHACCHNPSGLDPSEELWRKISDVVVERELVPFIDMAYQGFARDLEADAYSVHYMADKVPEMIVSNSCSKNFGLYRDRVGSLSVLCESSASREIVKSQLSNIVRTVYSVPPDHGAAIVSHVLRDEGLHKSWLIEVAAMRDRMHDMRELLQSELSERAPEHDFSHLRNATGMFCFLGVTQEQVERLKREFGIYMTSNSRINVAGITESNVTYLAESIAAVC